MNNGQQMESKKDQTEKILRLLTKRGFIGDEDINDEKIRSAQRERQKVAYHNTELLLKQYKNIAWMIECFPDTIAEELEQPFEKVDDVINRLDIEMSLGNRKVENRLASIRKTRLVLDMLKIKNGKFYGSNYSFSLPEGFYLNVSSAVKFGSKRLELASIDGLIIMIYFHNHGCCAKKETQEIIDANSNLIIW